jgi:hypothetical protein
MPDAKGNSDERREEQPLLMTLGPAALGLIPK